MARKSERLNTDNEMEERDPTPEEIEQILGTGAASVTPQITAAYDPSRDDDPEPASRPHPQAPGGFDFDRMTRALESLEARAAQSADPGALASAMAMIAQAMTGMKEGMLQGAQIQADMQRRVQLPENRVAPMISAYNPRGDKDFPRPALKCDMRIPWQVEPESMTREELELLNLLEEGEFWVTRSDRSRVQMRVTVERKLGTDEPNLITVAHKSAFNRYEHRQLPFDWIRQMVTNNPATRERALKVLTIDEERALIAAGKFNDGRVAIPGERLVSVGE